MALGQAHFDGLALYDGIGQAVVKGESQCGGELSELRLAEVGIDAQAEHDGSVGSEALEGFAREGVGGTEGALGLLLGGDALFFDSGEFALTIGEEFAVEGLTYEACVKGEGGSSVDACFVTCEEEHDFGEFVTRGDAYEGVDKGLDLCCCLAGVAALRGEEEVGHLLVHPHGGAGATIELG